MLMTVLHLVTRSPQQSHALDACLGRLQEGDAVLLLADGVYAVACAMSLQQLRATGERCYLLQADMEARGLLDVDLPPPLIAVDYSGFVALSVEHRHSLTWY